MHELASAATREEETVAAATRVLVDEVQCGVEGRLEAEPAWKMDWEGEEHRIWTPPPSTSGREMG